jgi:hypothetical protein
MDWEEKVWGYTGASGLVQGFTAGYFLWDLFVTLANVNIFGAGMLAHAVSALFVYSLGFVRLSQSLLRRGVLLIRVLDSQRPFMNFYGPTFILYELSSPFLNIHWFCDKLNLTGSKIQLYNGIMLLFTFFSCRLVWGSYQSIRIFTDIFHAMQHGGSVTNSRATPNTGEAKSEVMRFADNRVVPVWLAFSYLGANIVLNSLNWFWFAKMIETVRKRFDPPLGTKGTEKTKHKEKVLVEGIDVDTDVDTDVDGVTVKSTGVVGSDATQITRGTYADGRRTVEVEKREVRSRRRG